MEHFLSFQWIPEGICTRLIKVNANSSSAFFSGVTQRIMGSCPTCKFLCSSLKLAQELQISKSLRNILKKKNPLIKKLLFQAVMTFKAVG